MKYLWEFVELFVGFCVCPNDCRLKISNKKRSSPPVGAKGNARKPLGCWPSKITEDGSFA